MHLHPFRLVRCEREPFAVWRYSGRHLRDPAFADHFRLTACRWHELHVPTVSFGDTDEHRLSVPRSIREIDDSLAAVLEDDASGAAVRRTLDHGGPPFLACDVGETLPVV